MTRRDLTAFIETSAKHASEAADRATGADKCASEAARHAAEAAERSEEAAKHASEAAEFVTGLVFDPNSLNPTTEATVRAAEAARLAAEASARAAEATSRAVVAADLAAETAVQLLLLKMGVDIATPETIIEFQHDLTFLRLIRDLLEKKALWWMLGAIVSLLVTLCTLVIAHVMAK